VRKCLSGSPVNAGGLLNREAPREVFEAASLQKCNALHLCFSFARDASPIALNDDTA
jgi:hypothetical protein